MRFSCVGSISATFDGEEKRTRVERIISSRTQFVEHKSTYLIFMSHPEDAIIKFQCVHTNNNTYDAFQCKFIDEY